MQGSPSWTPQTACKQSLIWQDAGTNSAERQIWGAESTSVERRTWGDFSGPMILLLGFEHPRQCMWQTIRGNSEARFSKMNSNRLLEQAAGFELAQPLSAFWNNSIWSNRFGQNSANWIRSIGTDLLRGNSGKAAVEAVTMSRVTFSVWKF